MCHPPLLPRHPFLGPPPTSPSHDLGGTQHRASPHAPPSPVSTTPPSTPWCPLSSPLTPEGRQVEASGSPPDHVYVYVCVCSSSFVIEFKDESGKVPPSDGIPETRSGHQVTSDLANTVTASEPAASGVQDEGCGSTGATCGAQECPVVISGGQDGSNVGTQHGCFSRALLRDRDELSSAGSETQSTEDKDEQRGNGSSYSIQLPILLGPVPYQMPSSYSQFHAYFPHPIPYHPSHSSHPIPSILPPSSLIPFILPIHRPHTCRLHC